MESKNKYYVLVVVLISLLVQGAVYGQTAKPKKANPGADPAITKLKMAVEANPNDLDAHQAYIKAMGFNSPELIKQYDKWIKKYPSSPVFPYAIGNALSNSEDPKAKPYLLKAIHLDPKFAEAYDALASDAERWGQFDSSFLYLKKAAELEPGNADYVFSFAYANKPNKEKYKELSLKVAKDFPNSPRGSQSLYWLANTIQDPNEKIIYYEQQKRDFPIDKFDWTEYGMGDYYSLLLTMDARKALALAEEILPLVEKESGSKKSWESNIEMAKNVVKINSLLEDKNAPAALAIVNNIKVPRYGSAKEFIIMLKSKVLDEGGDSKEAYKNILSWYAKEPEEKLKESLLQYGSKLGKAPANVDADVWYVRDTAAKQAPNFTLENYFTKKPNSLSDYKGKVILLTYWFPGCGPCRGEFPHFENVVKKFKNRNDFVYLGINIVPEQDAYVLPFLKSSHYSFIPLKDHKNWKKGPLDNRGMAPMNFLVDENGKIVFKDFRTDGSNEQTLETMIGSMLDRKAGHVTAQGKK